MNNIIHKQMIYIWRYLAIIIWIFLHASKRDLDVNIEYGLDRLNYHLHKQTDFTTDDKHINIFGYIYRENPYMQFNET